MPSSNPNPFILTRPPAMDWGLPFSLAVARGWVPGVTGMHKFGRNPIASSDPEDVWDAGGLYVWLTKGQQVNFVSTAKGDIIDMMVFGLDSDGIEISETVTLDGDSDVLGTNTYYRLNRMKVLYPPSTDAAGSNTGTITATSTDGTVMAQIQQGYGQTLMSIYTIPAGKVGTVEHAGITMGQTTKEATARLKFRQGSTGAWQVKHTDEVVGGESETGVHYMPEIPPMTDIRWETQLAAGQTNEVSGDFTILLFDADS